MFSDDFEDDVKVYFVAETKNTGGKRIDFDKLRTAERRKIKCGEKCFADDTEVEFEVVQKVDDCFAQGTELTQK